MVELQDRPLVAPTDIVAVAQPKLPAVVAGSARPVVFERQAQFEDLMELRGQAPDPFKLRHIVLNGGASWGPVLAGAAVAIGLPLELVAAVSGTAVATSAVALLIGGLVVGGIFNRELPSPLAMVTRYNHLRERDLRFLGNLTEASPVEQAVVGLMAARWLTRIDKQRVYGEEAYAILEDIIAKGKTLDEAVVRRAQRLVDLHDATVNHRDGRPLYALTTDQVNHIVSQFDALDPDDRASCGAELMKRYFKGEVARHHVQSHEAARRLYRTLRNGVKHTTGD